MTARSQVVQVEVASALVDLAADALWQAGPSAVAIDDLAGGVVRLTADVADVDRVAPLPAGATLRVLEVDSGAYLDRWRQWAVPRRAGRRLVLQPAWQPASPEGDDLVVLLDPGRTFGSGSHPSTRLAVAALEAHVHAGQQVLDVGTGSGVLAVAAALLGAGSVVAVDIDPAAPAVVAANAARNGVAHLVVASTTPVDAVPGRFDLVAANIGATVLCSLAGALTSHLRPGGLLVLAGLLDTQVDEVVAAFPVLAEVARDAEEGWVAAVLQRPS